MGSWGHQREAGYSFHHPLQVALLGMAALLSVAGVGGVRLNFPHGLGGQVVKFSPAVSGLGSCVASYLGSYLDKLPTVACPLQSPSARVNWFAQWLKCHVHLSFAVSEVGRVTLVLRTVEEALLPEPGVRED